MIINMHVKGKIYTDTLFKYHSFIQVRMGKDVADLFSGRMHSYKKERKKLTLLIDSNEVVFKPSLL